MKKYPTNWNLNIGRQWSHFNSRVALLLSWLSTNSSTCQPTHTLNASHSTHFSLLGTLRLPFAVLLRGQRMGSWRPTLICILLLLSFLPTPALMAQRFFNLTTQEVKTDSVLPNFGYSIPLDHNYQDSVYTVSILYPEFVDMTSSDIYHYNRLSGTALPQLPAIRQDVTFNKKEPSLTINFCPLVFRNNRYQVLASFMLKVDSKPITRSTRKNSLTTRVSAASSRYADNSVLASGTWAKIRVPSTGIYQITEALIRQAGFTDINKVKIYGYGGQLQNEALRAVDLTEYDDLKEVPTAMVGGKRLFYALGTVSWSRKDAPIRTRNPYSDYGYYFLTQTEEAPKTISTEELHALAYPSNNDYHTLHEIDNFAWYQGGRNLCENTPISQGTTHTYTLKTGVAETTGNITVAITAGVTSSATVSLNGETLGTLYIHTDEHDHGNDARQTFANVKLKETNTVEITPVTGGPVRLDYIDIYHPIARPAPDFTADAFPTPQYVHRITNQNLHAHTAADMVIIIPTSQKLLAQAERLKAFREQHDGLRVRIVPSDEIINEFASGTPDANAYRRYLKMLYDRAETTADQPKYLLLFGDAAWDNRMNTNDWRQADINDYLLCFESENSFNAIYCYVDDSFFGLLDDGEGVRLQESDLVDVAVGRFPVTTEDDAKTLVDKTINYTLNKNAGGWQNTLVFMGDDGNNNIHMRDVNEAAQDIESRYPGYVIKKVMWDAYKRETSSTGHSFPDVTGLIKQYQAAGALIMDYAGHGRADQIAHEAVLKINDFEQFNNTNLPLWITASCDIMPFDGTIPTIGERTILNKNGGAVAFYGTTRTVYANYNKYINMAFLRHVLSFKDGKPMTLGEAHRLARNEMIVGGLDRTTNKLQYSLLGDPALALHLPTAEVVIDSINGVAVNETGLQAALEAGGIAKVSGHVKNAEHFNGVVTAVVRDKKETIIGKLNDTSKEGASTPFEYTDRTKTLYNGSDSVRNGRFVLTFAVSKDINYGEGNAQINISAVSNDRKTIAHGMNDNLTIKSGEKMRTDSIGPSIFAYINTPAFTDGDKVNRRPYFVATLTDKDGLNTTGNGIGHDIQLVIDGDPSRTYNLNDYFKYDFGSYTSGQVQFSIPELPAGPHTLTFRAWDILNNSSTTTLTFQVVEGLAPGIISLASTENPAKTTTTFIVNHDYVNVPVDVEIEVFDSSGRMWWKNAEQNVMTGGTYTYQWDLATSMGAKLQTGVYVYRVKMTAQGTSQTSKTQKLVILRQ